MKTTRSAFLLCLFVFGSISASGYPASSINIPSLGYSDYKSLFFVLVGAAGAFGTYQLGLWCYGRCKAKTQLISDLEKYHSAKKDLELLQKENAELSQEKAWLLQENENLQLNNEGAVKNKKIWQQKCKETEEFFSGFKQEKNIAQVEV